MASHIKYHLPFISKFNKKIGKKRMAKYIRRASEDEIHSICECALNICNGNVPISKKQLKKLRKYRRSLQHLAAGRSNLHSKKHYLKQKGGALLPIIAATVLPLLTRIFND